MELSPSNDWENFHMDALYPELDGNLIMQTGLMDDGVKLALLASWMGLFVVFAGRKFTQPIKVEL